MRNITGVKTSKNLVECAAALLAAAILFPASLLADSEKVGGVKWEYYPIWDEAEGETVAVVTGADPLKGVLNIPPSLGGLPVREIGAYAFCDGGKVTEVVFPDSLTYIGECAFDSCIGLTSVSIPGNVKEIGEEAFCDCDNLASINLAEGIEIIGYDAFCDCENLGDVYIPSTVREGIGFAFAYKMNSIAVADGNPHFKSIDGAVYSKDGTRLVFFPAGRAGEWVVPEHVAEIDDEAFAGGSLSAITIGSGVGRIGKSAFICSFGLNRIAVDASNPHFRDVDGVLFSKDGMLMLAYPAAKDAGSVYTVPATVTRLGEGVFSGTSLAGVILPSTLAILPTEGFLDSKSLKSVIVGYGVKAVSEEAFHDLSLTGLTLPITVEEIGECAFEDVGTSKTTIYVPETAVADKYAYDDCPAKIARYSSAPLVKFDLNYADAPAYPYDRNVVGGQPVGMLMTPARDQYAFLGWYTLPEGGTAVAASSKVSEDVTYYAHWRLADSGGEDAKALPGLLPGADAYGVVKCGVAFNPELVDCAPADGWTAKASGLPPGLKYDAKAGRISGVPTKAGTFTVTFAASKGKERQSAAITLNVEALPLWATGSFSGYAICATDTDEMEDEMGAVSMTVAANGKIGGKLALLGKSWTFNAASYAKATKSAYVVKAEAKSGKSTMAVSLEVRRAEDALAAVSNGVAAGRMGRNCEVTMWRNVWKDKATAAKAKKELSKWEGLYTLSLEDGGYLSLNIGKDGVVKASGKLSDGTKVSAASPLSYDADDGWLAYFYSAPGAYKGGSFAIAVTFDGPHGKLGMAGFMDGAQWTSQNPKATDEYGEGFALLLDFAGAYYGKKPDISAWSSAKFSVAPPDSYSFDGVAPKVSFAPATGVFKGSCSFLPDEGGRAKKASFEGIVVLGAESLCGFYPWVATGYYDDPKTDVEKAYKYKESYQVELRLGKLATND